MTVKFKVKIFDDQNEWIESTEREISEILSEHALIGDYSDNDGLSISKEDLSNTNDLIIMDYKLAQSETGTSVIQKIRELQVYTDILFCSSHYDEMIQDVKSQERPLEGVYFVHRTRGNEFSDKLHALISMILRRSEDVENLRGMIMDQFSDFETRVRDILISIDQQKPDEIRSESYSRIEECIKKSKKSREDKIIKISKETDKFRESINNPTLLDCYSRLTLLAEDLEILKKDKGINNDVANKLKELNKYRNKLAHVKRGENTIKVDDDTVEINEDLHKKLREMVNESDRLLTELQDIVMNEVDAP